MLFEQVIQDELVVGKEKSTEAIREVTILVVRNFVAEWKKYVNSSRLGSDRKTWNTMQFYIDCFYIYMFTILWRLTHA